jgi:uncharacterized protein YjbI with pentapeptide repeats
MGGHAGSLFVTTQQPSPELSTMRRLFSRTRFVAPFLFSERGSVQLTRALRSAGGGAKEFDEGLHQKKLQLEGEHRSHNLTARVFSDCSSLQLRLLDCQLTGATWRRSLLRGAELRNLEATESRWEVVDLEGASILDGKLNSSEFQLVSFRDAEFKNSELRGSRFILCDFSGAHFEGVDFAEAHFIGCDFEDAIFEEGVNFSNADLTGSQLQRCWVGGATFVDAILDECDFRGALGAVNTKALVEAGATYRPGLLGSFFQRVLGREANQHKRVLLAVSLTWAFVALALPGLFFARAINNPVDPDQLPFVETTEEASEEDTQND